MNKIAYSYGVKIANIHAAEGLMASLHAISTKCPHKIHDIKNHLTMLGLMGNMHADKQTAIIEKSKKFLTELCASLPKTASTKMANVELAKGLSSSLEGLSRKCPSRIHAIKHSLTELLHLNKFSETEQRGLLSKATNLVRELCSSLPKTAALLPSALLGSALGAGGGAMLADDPRKGALYGAAAGAGVGTAKNMLMNKLMTGKINPEGFDALGSMPNFMAGKLKDFQQHLDRLYGGAKAPAMKAMSSEIPAGLNPAEIKEYLEAMKKITPHLQESLVSAGPVGPAYTKLTPSQKAAIAAMFIPAATGAGAGTGYHYGKDNNLLDTIRRKMR